MRQYKLGDLEEVLPRATNELEAIVSAIRSLVECPCTLEVGGGDWNAVIEIQKEGQKPEGVINLLLGDRKQ